MCEQAVTEKHFQGVFLQMVFCKYLMQIHLPNQKIKGQAEKVLINKSRSHPVSTNVWK